MLPWQKTAVFSTVAAVAVGAALYFGAPHVLHTQKAAVENPPAADFSKTAYDESGNVLTGPVAVGQVINYVLRYNAPPSGSSGVSGPATIDDTLSANQTYGAGSVHAPGWTLSTPLYNGNHETYTSPVSGPASFTLTIPAISGSAGAPGGGGDGYKPIPVVTSVGTKVFGVFHHQAANNGIMCWIGATLGKCAPAYPMRISTSPEQRATPDLPHAAVYNKKIYFPVGRYDENLKTTLEFGMGCWDADADAECPFVSLPGQPSLNMTGNTVPYLGTRLDDYVAGVRADPLQPSHLLMYAAGKIYCVDIALAGAPACTGWTPMVIAPTDTTGLRTTDMFVEENGTRLFFSNSTVSVRCIDLSNGSTCAGWPAAGVNGGATTATHLGPGLDSTGAMNAICLSQTFGNPSNFRCFDLATGATTTSWPVAPLSTSAIFAAYHIPGTKRVLYPPYANNTVPKCWDFGTAAFCMPFAPYWKSNASWTDGSGVSHNPVKDYGYASDPTAPQDCIYGLGDGGILVRFGQDGTAATGACAPKNYHATFSLNDQFCFHPPGQATWTTVEIANRPSTLTGGTITLKDSAGTVVQTLVVTASNSYTLNIPATGLDNTITVEFAPTYAGNTPPTTDYQIRLNYTADEPSQICYKATVTTCGEVSNVATLKDDIGTRDAKVNLGSSYGGTCGPPPVTQASCLNLTPSVTMNPDGTCKVTLVGGTSGFSARQVNVQSQTPGVTVQPPSRQFSSGTISGDWQLSGVTPGQKVTLQVNATDPGAGKNGTDKCCSSTITVTVPSDKLGPDLGINKIATVEAQGPANGGGYTYTLGVTNVGTALNGQNNITVSDTVPAGLSFASASGTGWNCGSQFPIAAGGTLTCTYTGSGQLATGATLPPITVFAPGASGPVTNCATVAFSASSQLVDSNPANNRSCASGPQTPTGSITVTKVVDTDSLDYSMITFQVQVSCVAPIGAAVTSTLNLNSADSYHQTIQNLPVGDVCTITELPAQSPPTFPPNCHWKTTYPDGQQVTVQSGTKTVQVVNEQNCTASPPASQANVMITKTPVIDGKVTYTPGVGFLINAQCTKPSGAVGNFSYTAVAGSTFSTSAYNVPLGTTCTVNEPAPPLPAGRSQCHWATTYLFNGSPVASFPVTITADVSPSNVFEVRNVLDCGPRGTSIPPSEPPMCDSATTRLRGAECACLYPGMKPAGRDALTCSCPVGTQFRAGKGCVVEESACRDPSHWNGRDCVACKRGEEWDDRRGRCMNTQVCDERSTSLRGDSCQCRYDGMIRKSQTMCGCPAGSSLVPGQGCVKPRPVCDVNSTTMRGNSCLCRYEGMIKRSQTMCGCPVGTSLVPGVGCMKPHPVCDGVSTTSRGDSCACRYQGMTQTSPNRCMCSEGSTLEPGRGCVLTCHDPMTLNESRTACVCPSGTKLRDGKCVKKSSALNNLFNNVHIGIDAGGKSGRDRDTKPTEPKPDKNEDPRGH